MIDIEKAKEEFINYTKKYDVQNLNIARKIGHSLRVMEISNRLSTEIGLNDEQIKLATLIGLLHDIARFEQYKRFSTFRDVDSIDHGDFGVQLLKQDNYIRKFIKNEEYDDIILKAIHNHNKYSIEKGLNQEELLFAKIIRDSDKIDILYEAVDMFYLGEEDEISNSILDKEIEDQIINKKQIKRKKGYIPQGINKVFGLISFIYDINFKESFKIIKDKNYINDILNRFNFVDKDTKQKVEELRKGVNKYIEEKLK